MFEAKRYMADWTISSPTMGRPMPDADEPAAAAIRSCAYCRNGDDRGDRRRPATIDAVVDDEIREVDDELRDAGQFGPHVLEHLGEGGHHEPEHGGDGADGDADQDDRIHHAPRSPCGAVARDSRICLLSSSSTRDICPVISPVRMTSIQWCWKTLG